MLKSFGFLDRFGYRVFYTIAKGLDKAKGRVCSSQTKQKCLVCHFFMPKGCEVLELVEGDHLLLLGLFGVSSAARETASDYLHKSSHFSITKSAIKGKEWKANNSRWHLHGKN